MWSKSHRYYSWPVTPPPGLWLYRSGQGDFKGRFEQTLISKEIIFVTVTNQKITKDAFSFQDFFTLKELSGDFWGAFRETEISPVVLAAMTRRDRAWLRSRGITTLEGVLASACIKRVLKGYSKLFPDGELKKRYARFMKLARQTDNIFADTFHIVVLQSASWEAYSSVRNQQRAIMWGWERGIRLEMLENLRVLQSKQLESSANANDTDSEDPGVHGDTIP